MDKNDKFDRAAQNISLKINDEALGNVAGGKAAPIQGCTWDVCPACGNKSLLRFLSDDFNGRMYCTKCGYGKNSTQS